MIIVPIKGDPFTTVDGKEFTVSAFNGLKKDSSTGKLFPSVYAEGYKGGTIAFEDIKEIKRVRVDFDKASGMLVAMGPVKRSVQLPQSNDRVTIKSPFAKGEEIEITVGKIKLSNSGGTYSLRVGFTEKGDDTTWYDLSTIVNIDNGMSFNKSKFEQLYLEYFPASFKSKG